MYLTGFADEAAADIDGQIRATKELGWKFIEARAVDGVNITSIGEEKFSEVCEKLAKAEISINCFGSGVGNWACKITEPPEGSYKEMKRAIARMDKLGTRMIRIMSFAVPPGAAGHDFFAETVKRIKVIVKMAEDGGVICVHENCAGWAGLSYENTLRLLDGINSPALKLVFDTGNPVFTDDVRGTSPYRKQNSWDFYKAVREHIVYLHIKDCYLDGEKEIYTFPGEGKGCVREILSDLLKTGYEGGFSIEPHIAVVFHDPSVTSADETRYRNYIEYGRRVEKMLAGMKV